MKDYNYEWLSESKTNKKNKKGFGFIEMNVIIIFFSVFISLVPIFVTSLINIVQSDLEISVLKNQIICRNDFQYINVSVLFIVFVEHNLISNKVNTKFSKILDTLCFIWLICAFVFWVLTAAIQKLPYYISTYITKYENFSLVFLCITIILSICDVIAQSQIKFRRY